MKLQELIDSTIDGADARFVEVNQVGETQGNRILDIRVYLHLIKRSGQLPLGKDYLRCKGLVNVIVNDDDDVLKVGYKLKYDLDREDIFAQ